MLKQIFLAAALMFAVTGCVTQSSIAEQPQSLAQPEVATLFDCSYKYDSGRNVKFLDTNRQIFHPQNFPALTVYHITDINGKHWSINQFEWADYTCTTTQE